MELGEPDASGRRRPVKVADSAFELPTDCVIVAAGALANPLLTKNTSGLQLNQRGYIIADNNGRTSRSHVWAGGDIVTGSATVILAMGAGRTAAKDINCFLRQHSKHGNNGLLPIIPLTEPPIKVLIVS